MGRANSVVDSEFGNRYQSIFRSSHNDLFDWHIYVFIYDDEVRIQLSFCTSYPRTNARSRSPSSAEKLKLRQSYQFNESKIHVFPNHVMIVK